MCVYLLKLDLFNTCSLKYVRLHYSVSHHNITKYSCITLIRYIIMLLHIPYFKFQFILSTVYSENHPGFRQPSVSK